MSEERGSITLWMVGLMMLVFAVGGIAVDLWRGLAAHRQLASVVDAAAVAGGSAIDEERWRFEGELVLDPARVEEAVALTMSAQSVGPGFGYHVATDSDGSAATISAATTVDLTLLALLVEGGLEVSAVATAVPTLVP